MNTAPLHTGVRLPYLEQGDPGGTPVVLLHAWADSQRFFEPALPHLPDWMRVIVPSQRGHGDADKPPSGYELADFSADVAAFLDVLNIPRAVIVGHSSGGYVAQRFAVDHPHRTAGLVLIGAPRSLHGRRLGFTDAVEALRDPIDPLAVKALLGSFRLFHPVPEAFLEEMVAESVKVPAQVWKAVLTGLTTARPPTESGTITAPTLILWGDRDDVLLREEQEALAASIPGSRFVIYPGVGHLVLWEQPERVARELSAFVQCLV